MKLKFIALTITALLFSVRVFSAPYATTYTSIIDGVHPDTEQGESFRLTLVMDNGGATAASQSWGGSDLQCLIFEFNDARDVVLAVDLVAQPPISVGVATPDSAGTLTRIFTAVYGQGLTTGYTDAGFTNPPGSVFYYANGGNAIFFDDAGAVEDIAGGIQMDAVLWDAPLPYAGDCVARVSAPSAPATSVPALPLGALWVLGGLAGLLGMRQLRKTA